jgi:hypothetical protein
VNSPAARMIAAQLQNLGIFFEDISIGWTDAKVKITLLREEDALEVACFFSTAGWGAHAEGRIVRAQMGVS